MALLPCCQAGCRESAAFVVAQTEPLGMLFASGSGLMCDTHSSEALDVGAIRLSMSGFAEAIRGEQPTDYESLGKPPTYADVGRAYERLAKTEKAAALEDFKNRLLSHKAGQVASRAVANAGYDAATPHVYGIAIEAAIAQAEESE